MEGKRPEILKFTLESTRNRRDSRLRVLSFHLDLLLGPLCIWQILFIHVTQAAENCTTNNCNLYLIISCLAIIVLCQYHSGDLVSPAMIYHSLTCPFVCKNDFLLSLLGTRSPTNKDIESAILTTRSRSMRLSSAPSTTVSNSPSLYSEDNVVSSFVTPEFLLLASEMILHSTLPLVLPAIDRVSSISTRREEFVNLMQILKLRISASRTLKLRFMLLVNTDPYKGKWELRQIFRKDCYSIGLVDLKIKRSEFFKNLEKMKEKEGSEEFQPATIKEKEHHEIVLNGLEEMSLNKPVPPPLNQAEQMRKLIQILKTESMSDSVDLGQLDSAFITYAVTEVFNTEVGVTTGKNTHPKNAFLKYDNSFQAKQLVSWLMANLNLTNRSHAIQLCISFAQRGLIERAHDQTKPFQDNKDIWINNVARQEEDFKNIGNNFGSEQGTSSNSSGLLVSMDIFVDLIDKQSFDFWSSTILRFDISEGYVFYRRSVIHPVLVDYGIDRRLNGQTVEGNCTCSVDEYVDWREATQLSPNDKDVEKGMETFLEDDQLNLSRDVNFVSNIVCSKVFSSAARPFIISLQVPNDETIPTDSKTFTTQPFRILVKKGDNLFQDMSTECMFRLFNALWETSPLFPDPKQAPFSYSYEVFPITEKEGFMQAVSGVESLKEYDWNKWLKIVESDPTRINIMLRSAAGSLIAAYVVGARDRHWDNILIKDDRIMMHIDFGFLMGAKAPIDGPPVSVSPMMESAFQNLEVWNKFVDLCCKAYGAIRRQPGFVVRAASLLFTRVGLKESDVISFVQGSSSLNLKVTEEEAVLNIRKQIENSSRDLKNSFKQYSHETVDPVFYKLLEKKFPPAVLAMKIVDYQHDKKTKTAETAKKKKEKEDSSRTRDVINL